MSQAPKSHSREDTPAADQALMQKRRIQLVEDGEDGRYETIQELCNRHGFSRRWFYHWKPRWESEGEAGIRSRKAEPESASNVTEPS